MYTRGVTPSRTLIPSHATSGVIPPSHLDTLPRHARYKLRLAPRYPPTPRAHDDPTKSRRQVESWRTLSNRRTLPLCGPQRGDGHAGLDGWTQLDPASEPATGVLASGFGAASFRVSDVRHLRDSAVTSRCSFSCRFKIALLISKNLMHLASCLPYLHYINIDFFQNSSIMKRSGYIASLLISKTKIMYLAICILFELIILQYVIISSVIFGLKTYHII
jgi:hypothetical protein